MSKIFNDIIELIPEALFPVNKKISKGLTLENDFGIYGDDAVEFIQKFGKKFNVDVKSVNYDKYFSNENDWFTLWMRKIFKLKPSTGKTDLTLGDLEEAIKKGKLE